MDEQFDEELIELELIDDDTTLDKIVRRSFRIPLNNTPDCLVSIKGESFPLIDISPYGTCFVMGGATSFHVDQILRQCCLNLDGTEICNIDCQVVRVTPGNENCLFCGVKWVHATVDQKQCLEIVCDSFKKKLFEKKQ